LKLLRSPGSSIRDRAGTSTAATIPPSIQPDLAPNLNRFGLSL
jgi:hypothetical protein